jgi:Ran GTPase-activating protein 1
MSGAKIFSLEGKGLKLTTAEDIEPHIQDLKSNNQVEEIKFLGNTLGVEASKALAEVLETKKTLKVYMLHQASRLHLQTILTHSTGRKPRGHLHVPSTFRNSARTLSPRQCAPHTARATHRRPLRQRFRPKHGCPARRLPLRAHTTALLISEQQRSRPRRRCPRRRCAHCSRCKEGCCA